MLSDGLWRKCYVLPVNEDDIPWSVVKCVGIKFPYYHHVGCTFLITELCPAEPSNLANQPTVRRVGGWCEVALDDQLLALAHEFLIQFGGTRVDELLSECGYGFRDHLLGNSGLALGCHCILGVLDQAKNNLSPDNEPIRTSLHTALI